tara:strand:+ start:1567 stop:1755 length:189 start_codon:yes stop_codon:yes gene_type:complete
MFAQDSVLKRKRGNCPMITDGKSPSSVIPATTPLNSKPLIVMLTKDFVESNALTKPWLVTKE